MYLTLCSHAIYEFLWYKCDIFKLKGDNYKVWKEGILTHLRWMGIDYTTKKYQSIIIATSTSEEIALATSTSEEISLYKCWEQSNHFSVMFIKTKIYAGIYEYVE